MVIWRPEGAKKRQLKSLNWPMAALDEQACVCAAGTNAGDETFLFTQSWVVVVWLRTWGYGRVKKLG